MKNTTIHNGEQHNHMCEILHLIRIVFHVYQLFSLHRPITYSFFYLYVIIRN